MLGFLAAVMNETQTGLGPIGQVAFALGNINPSDELYRTVGLWIVAWGILVTGIAYASGHAGTALGEEDIF
ncbi:hypothetical protein MNEG_5547 [Monoraphidium neglectum]|uniref:Uncharacterized protein n=1 Tax=Monoraphidium neglectum TaxID=145388 RepID=A0A0D2MH56_9CHLO|nr:hypothetical protein MNEG_5547 [Monoraphidium neglectum]KIZ02415.1 hypothetical protein MNEG_5547 [Monoraphidium neglectum]|eukprot:XP_013901434.1 hypothetical protein MNEG_5547 [Monoraphidium neglectum]